MNSFIEDAGGRKFLLGVLSIICITIVMIVIRFPIELYLASVGGIYAGYAITNTVSKWSPEAVITASTPDATEIDASPADL